MAEIRTFIAIEVESAILARLYRCLQQQLRAAGAQVSWVRTEGMHLTLKFLGNISEQRLPEFAQVLVSAADTTAPFRIHVAQVGCFPNLARMRVVWAGVEAGAEKPVCSPRR